MYILQAGQWFSQGSPVSSTTKTDRHNITEILLKVALNTIQVQQLYYYVFLDMAGILPKMGGKTI
jgi:hypothetical protein